MYANVNDIDMLNWFFLPLNLAGFATGADKWRSWDKTYANYNGFEAISNGFEAISIGMEAYYPDLVTKHPKIANSVRKIQNWLPYSSGFFTLFNLLKSFRLLDKKFNFFPKDWVNKDGHILINRYTLSTNTLMWAGPPAVYFIFYKLTSIANNYFWKKDQALDLIDKKTLKENQTLSYDHSSKEQMHQQQLLMRLASSVTWFALTRSPLALFNFALEAYSFITIAKRHWIQYSITFEVGLQTIQQITIDLFMRVYPSWNEEDCLICIDTISKSDSETKSALPGMGVLCCSRHVFHLNCITNWVNTNLKRLLDGLHVPEPYEEQYNKPVSYQTKMSTDALSSCPKCRELPIYEVEGTVKEINGKVKPLYISLTPPPPIPNPPPDQ